MQERLQRAAAQVALLQLYLTGRKLVVEQPAETIQTHVKKRKYDTERNIVFFLPSIKPITNNIHPCGNLDQFMDKPGKLGYTSPLKGPHKVRIMKRIEQSKLNFHRKCNDHT